jgi:hypothetical protein
LRKGSATRAIGGYSTHETRRIVSCVGLTIGTGGEGAWSTSRTLAGGLSYPEEAVAGSAGEGAGEARSGTFEAGIGAAMRADGLGGEAAGGGGVHAEAAASATSVDDRTTDEVRRGIAPA